MSTMNSALVSAVLTRFFMVFFCLMLTMIPFIMKLYDDYQLEFVGSKSIFIPLVILGYSACIVGIAALFMIDRLLKNIRNSDVFIDKNIKLIRAISYLCFLEAIIFGVFGFYRPLSFMVAAAAAFLGLIVRVVKNTFDIAVNIKEENEFTI